MDELEEDARSGEADAALASERAQAGPDREPDRVVTAKSFPHDKGSSQ
jgi:hypothetical protein